MTLDANTPVQMHRMQKSWQPSALTIRGQLVVPYHYPGVAVINDVTKRSTAQSRSKLLPKSPGPWIPPPAKSNWGLKVEPAERDIDDPDNFESRVESLISEVGKLRSEAELSRTRRKLSASQEQLNQAQMENSHLRKSVDFLSQEMEGDELAKQLIAAELDLQTLNRHLLAFGDLLRSAKPPLRQSERDAFASAQDALCHLAADLGADLQRLRRQLRERGDTEREATELAAERTELLRLLADADIGRSAAEEESGRLKSQVAGMREHDATGSGLLAALESAKAHLQFQLGQRDAENARVSGLLRGLETELARTRVERDRATELLHQSAEPAAMTAAVKAEAEAAVSKEEVARQRAAAAEADAAVARQESGRLLEWCELLGQENERLRMRAQLDGRAELVSGEERLRLQASVKSLEKQLEMQQLDIEALRGTLKHYENLIEDYKQQVRSKLSQRLDDLEDVPEILRQREMEFIEARAQLRRYEQHQQEQTEHLACRCSSSLERAELQQQENRVLRDRCEDLEKRLRLADDERREAQRSLARMQESGGSLAGQLEAKQRECTALIEQLEQATSDSRRLQDQEAAAAREKRLQARLLELESDMAAQRAESTRAMHEKDEETRRTHQRLEDIKERLEQSQSTNRSLQNYVNFLKASYANVLTSAGAALPTMMQS